MNDLLLLKNVTVSYINKDSKISVLKNISLDIEPNTITGIMGSSGSGKTTLIKSIICETNIDMEITGKILYCDICYYNDKLIDKKVLYDFFYVPQVTASAISPLHKVKIVFFDLCEARKVDKSKAINNLETWLNKMGLKSDVLDRYPYELSGGMLQRVMIGMGLSLNPKLLLLDEPTSALDMDTQENIISVLREANSNGMTTIVVSHEKEFIKLLCDDIYIINDREVFRNEHN